MAYIKTQKIVRDSSGRIVSGSASIIVTSYDPKVNYHAKKTVRERLGKVLFLSEDKKSGIFLSPTRGLVEYSSCSDEFQEVEHDDPRLDQSTQFPKPEIHTVFGDAYLLLEFMKKTGLLEIFRSVFTKKGLYERVVVHLLHDILAVGSRISCDDFLNCSFASYLFEDIPLAALHSDSSYYTMMGKDSLRVDFFRKFADMMKSKSAGSNSYIEGSESFGKGCYVDSTPLPNEIRRLMSNAYCSHGTEGSCSQTRMSLVLDDQTDLPVWYGMTPGNVLDLSTINDIASDTFVSVGIEIDSMVLDAGYITREFLSHYAVDSEKTFIGKSPAKRGFQFKTRYHEVKNLIPNAKYEIFRNSKAYFAYKKQDELFGKKIFSYIFVDQMNALSWHTEFVEKCREEFEQMSDKDKNWNRVKNGFFILLSNIDTSCEEILNRYIERVNIESVFKDAKDYGNLLPLSKWDRTRVNGKIFSDMLATIVILLLKKKLIPNGFSLPDFAGKPISLMCCRNREGIVNIETPNKQVKELFRVLEIPVPGSLNLKEYSRRIYGPTFE